MSTELFIVALAIVIPNFTVILLAVITEHNRNQQAKRSAELRSEVAAGHQVRRQALRSIGGHR